MTRFIFPNTICTPTATPQSVLQNPADWGSAAAFPLSPEGREQADRGLSSHWFRKPGWSVGGSDFCSLQIHSGRTAPTVGWLLSNASQVLHWTHPRSVTSSPAFLPSLIEGTDSNFPRSQFWTAGFPSGEYLKVQCWEWCKWGISLENNSPQFYYLSILWDILGHLVLHLKAQTKASKSFQLYTNVIQMTSADIFPEVYKLSNLCFHLYSD